MVSVSHVCTPTASVGALLTVSSIVSVILCMTPPANINKVKQRWLVTSHHKDINLHAPTMLGHPPLISLFVCSVEFGIWKSCRKRKASFSRSMAQQLYCTSFLVTSPEVLVLLNKNPLAWLDTFASPLFGRWLADLLTCLLECESSVWLASVAWLLQDRMILADTKAYGSQLQLPFGSVDFNTSDCKGGMVCLRGGLGLPGTRLRCTVD